MAYVKSHAIKKTVNKAIAYIVDKNKTDNGTLISGINCSINPKVAEKEMQIIKRKFNKEDGILAFHFIQSFDGFEVKPEVAHEIGVKFANKISGGKYKLVVATHLDKKNIHNHIIMNSVQSINGKKYHGCKEQLREIRKVSDEIVKEYGLSIIEKDSKATSKNYNKWAEETLGEHWKEYDNNTRTKDTYRFKIKKEINKLLRENKFNNWEEFVQAMVKDGFEVEYKNSSGGLKKYTTFKAPNQKRYIRDKSLGEYYTRDGICKRIENKLNEIKFMKTGVKNYKWLDFDLYRYKFKKASLGNNLALTGLIIRKIIFGFDKTKHNYEKLNYKAFNSLKKIEKALMIMDEESLETSSDLNNKLKIIVKENKEYNSYTSGMRNKFNELKSTEEELMKIDTIASLLNKTKEYEIKTENNNKLYEELSKILEMEKDINNKKYIQELLEKEREKEREK